MQNGHLDSVPVEKVKQFQIKLQEYLSTRKQSLLAAIVSKGALDKDLESDLTAALEEFKAGNPV
jgi:F-type H+-transporting ATPase subunit alpha